MTPRCITEPDVPGRHASIHWRPDGKEILAFGVKSSRASSAWSATARRRRSRPTRRTGKGQASSPTPPRAARACSTRRTRRTASGWRSSPTRAAGRSSCSWPRPGDLLLTSAKPTGVRACKAIWRSDGKELVVVQADEVCSGARRRPRAPARQQPRQADAARRERRQPGVPAAHARGVAMLCPSCRRQLDRGAGFCGSCGAPMPGHAAPLELVLGDRTRVPVMAEMTIGRAPGSTLVLDDPTVSRLHARISEATAAGVALLEDAGSSHGTWVERRADHRADRAARRDPAASRRPGAASSSAGATPPRPAGRSSCGRARAWSCRRWARRA